MLSNIEDKINDVWYSASPLYWEGDLACSESNLAELQLPTVTIKKDIGNRKENKQVPRERTDN